MLDALLENQYFVLGALLLACFVGYVTWRNNFKSRHAAACNVFRSAILTELGALYPTPARWLSDINTFPRSAFPKLQTAVTTFKPFVPWWCRAAFERAWFIYRLGPDGREIDKRCTISTWALTITRISKRSFRKTSTVYYRRSVARLDTVGGYNSAAAAVRQNFGVLRA